jgi:hypothetical protein
MEITIFTEIYPLGPEYEDGRQTYGIVFSAAVEGDYGSLSEDGKLFLRNLVCPWQWSLHDFKLVFHTVPLTEIRLTPRNKSGEDVSTLETDLQTALKAKLEENREFLRVAPKIEEDSDQPSTQRWTHVLQAVSRLPAPIPQALGMVRFASISKAEIDALAGNAPGPLQVSAEFDIKVLLANCPITPPPIIKGDFLRRSARVPQDAGEFGVSLSTLHCSPDSPKSTVLKPSLKDTPATAGNAEVLQIPIFGTDCLVKELTAEAKAAGSKVPARSKLRKLAKARLQSALVANLHCAPKYDDFPTASDVLGYGVLLREEGLDWTCLNYADLRWSGGQKEKRRIAAHVLSPAIFDLAEGTNANGSPKVVPSVMPPEFANSVLYDNAPLFGGSGYAGHADNEPDQNVDAALAFPVGVTKESAFGEDKAKLHRLKYGANYQTDVFAIGLCGNLPKDYCAVEAGKRIPWQLRDFAREDLPTAHEPFEFKRIQNMRPPCLQAGAGPRETAASLPIWPILPEDVHPRAGELLEQFSVARNLPIVLLRDSDELEFVPQEFRLFVHRPSVDQFVWLRQISTFDPGNANQEADANVHALARWIEMTAKNQTPWLPDLSAQDLEVAIFDLVSNQPRQTFTKHYDDANGIELFFKVGRTPGNYTQLSAGDVLRVDLCWLSSTGARGDSVSFVLEVAALPADPATLCENIAKMVTFETEKDLRRGAYWSLNHPSPPAELVYLHRVTFSVEQWSWNGAPIGQVNAADDFRQGIPYADVVPPNANMDPSPETVEMLFREGIRDQIYTSTLPGLPAVQVAFSHPLAAIPEDNPGAHVYRPQLNVFSRYHGIQRVKGGWTVPLTKLHALRCSWEGDLPAPRIIATIPLTLAHQTAPGSASNPGFLVLLDEPWHNPKIGGLAERFECEIVRGRPSPGREERCDFAPDPILDGHEDPYAGRDVVCHQPAPALGYTFDDAGAASTFARCSFFIPAPTLVPEPPDDPQNPSEPATEVLWWHFVRLRFRRLLQQDWRQQNAPLASEWTTATWNQILPPADRWHVQTSGGEIRLVEVGDLRLKDGEFFHGSEKVFPGVKNPQAPAQFRNFALITRSVANPLFGHESESFEAIRTIVATGLSGDLPVNGRLRLLELQFIGGDSDFLLPDNTNDVKLSTLREWLFGNESTRPIARITRVSPAIATTL